MSSYSKLLFHIVFATKARQHTIRPEWKSRLHAYTAGTATKLGATVIAIGGVSDHLHLLVGLKPTHAVADFVRELKKASTAWIHTELQVRNFAWQEGYGAFTVDPSTVTSIASYIGGQESHHAHLGSREEFLQMLQGAGVKVDLQYFE